MKRWLCLLYFCCGLVEARQGEMRVGMHKEHVQDFLSLIAREMHSVELVCVRLSDKEVTEALLKAARRGVRVEVIIGASSAKKLAVQALIEGGIEVYQWTKTERMLSSFCVLGGKHLWSNPMGFPASGRGGAWENRVWLEDSGSAQDMAFEFARIKTISHKLL